MIVACHFTLLLLYLHFSSVVSSFSTSVSIWSSDSEASSTGVSVASTTTASEFLPSSFPTAPCTSETNDTLGILPNDECTNRTFDASKYILTSFEQCDPSTQVTAITDAFSEMITIIDGYNALVDEDRVQYQYRDFDWRSAAAIEFFGPAEKNMDNRQNIIDNLNRAAEVMNVWRGFFWQDKLKVSCKDPLDYCSECNNLGQTIFAYTINNQPYVNFCPDFFSLPTLQGAFDLMDAKPLLERGGVYDYLNRGVVWAHELMHIGDFGKSSGQYDHITDLPVIGWPGIEYDPINMEVTSFYGPRFTKWIALSDTSGTGTDAADNAENYALFMLANYVDWKRGFYPSQPQLPLEPPQVNVDLYDNLNSTIFNVTVASQCMSLVSLPSSTSTLLTTTTTTSQSSPSASTTFTPCTTVADCPSDFCKSGYNVVCQSAFEKKRTYDPYFCVCLPDRSS